MKTQLQIVKRLIEKFPNDMELGFHIRSMFMEKYWEKLKKGGPSKWEKELDGIHKI